MDILKQLAEYTESIRDGLGNLTLIIFFVIFVYMFFSDFLGILRLAKMVLDVYRSDKKEYIINHIKLLLKTKGEFVLKITQFEYINAYYGEKTYNIIKKYWFNAETENEYGVISKQKATFYIDLQKACVEGKEQLEVLAVTLSLFIVQNIDLYNKRDHYIIVGQSNGNILLANRVANILGLPFIIVGDLAGKKDAIFGDFKNTDKPIIVDDILFTGTLLVKNLRTLYDNKLICKNICVIVQRSLAYQEQLAHFKNEKLTDIQTDFLYSFLDQDIQGIAE